MYFTVINFYFVYRYYKYTFAHLGFLENKFSLLVLIISHGLRLLPLKPQLSIFQ